jgi:CheY-like chemotaxis protein
MLVGRPPLATTRDRHARMRKQRFEEARPIGPQELQAPASVFLLLENMMALAPQRRYQTPAQLLEAVRAVRRELSAPAEKGRGGAPRSVFVVESDEFLQNALRDKFKELGYRVFMAADPCRALDRFRQHPYDALVVDAGTTGEDGLLVFEQVVAEAGRKRLPCAAIVILSEEQAEWAARLPAAPRAAALVRPVTLKQLHHKLRDLLQAGEKVGG